MTWQNQLISSLGGTRSTQVDQALYSFRKFIRSAVIGSVILLVCALVAILWANSPWSSSYFDLWETHITLIMGEWVLDLTLHQWVNEGLMMMFFLLVGLEVKEQILVGELSSVKRAMLPVAAAIGGMIVPALIYAIINGSGEGSEGWGVPMSTDIAFALGILALLGKRVPLSLKVFLAALAIADDIGAIAVITLFYTDSIAVEGILLALGLWLVIFALGRVGVFNAFIYFGLSCGVWLGFTIGGIHATIAGVLVAMAIPAHALINPDHAFRRLVNAIDPNRMGGRALLHDKDQQELVHDLNAAVHDIEPPLVQLERSLQPWVTFVVMPLFALSNAGVVIGGDILNTLTSPVSLGVIFGLLVGKPIGITLFAWLTVRSGIAELPSGLTLLHIHGVSWLAGIGFTVALFVTELAFVEAHVLADEAKIGILFASFIAGIIGFSLLRWLTSSQEIAPTPEKEMRPA